MGSTLPEGAGAEGETRGRDLDSGAPPIGPDPATEPSPPPGAETPATLPTTLQVASPRRRGSVGGRSGPAARTVGTTVKVQGGDTARVAPAASSTPRPDRYHPVRVLGSGGFGEVRLVHDRELGRDVAMKILRDDVGLSHEAQARFLAEIQLTATLSHPGIVAVYDAGVTPDGQLWYTMPEVRGRTFRAVIDAAFARVPQVSRRRLLDLYVRACEAVAHAHGKGVIHRDIKPENIMIGEHGEVLVMDWGIARRAGAPDSAPEVAGLGAAAGGDASVARALAFSPLRTRDGAVLGTPAYMPPEQARGELHRIGPATDVYALGALLLHVVTGKPPAVGPRFWEVSPALREQLHALDQDRDVPPDLAAICRRAMAPDPALRFPDAGALAAEMASFLDGAQRREQALAALDQARAQAGALEALRASAAETRAEARRALAAVRPSDPVESKLRGWELEDDAERLERQLALGEAEWIQLVHGALAKDPALPEAHAALADHYRDKLASAELGGHTADAIRFEVLLRAHDRGRHAAFLRGDGALTVVTDPPGAEVQVQRFVVRQRRLVPDAPRLLGASPLRDVQLAFGSFLLTLRAPGRADVRYPVAIERGGRWDGCPPGAAEPAPIALPLESEIGPNEVYVPAGWTWIGGDPEAPDALPRRRVWIDGFVMQRYPVTNEELLTWLNEVASHVASRASAGVPDNSGAPGDSGVTGDSGAPGDSGSPGDDTGYPGGTAALLETASALPEVARDATGRFVLRATALGKEKEGAAARPQLSWPASVDWHMAAAYARWWSSRTAKPWRLPGELEREKAARGPDGRFFVWGNQAEPVFACVAESHRTESLPEPVSGHPTDESVYGIRGLSGNRRDWCANVWRRDGPRIEGDRALPDQAPPGDDDFRVIKGGAWGSSIVHSRAAARFGSRPAIQRLFVGFRLVRSYPAR